MKLTVNAKGKLVSRCGDDEIEYGYEFDQCVPCQTHPVLLLLPLAANVFSGRSLSLV